MILHFVCPLSTFDGISNSFFHGALVLPQAEDSNQRYQSVSRAECSLHGDRYSKRTGSARPL